MGFKSQRATRAASLELGDGACPGRTKNMCAVAGLEVSVSRSRRGACRRLRMSRTKTITLDEFAAYVEARPARLGCWREGSSGRYPTLAWLNVHPIVEQRALASNGAVWATALRANSRGSEAV